MKFLVFGAILCFVHGYNEKCLSEGISIISREKKVAQEFGKLYSTVKNYISNSCGNSYLHEALEFKMKETFDDGTLVASNGLEIDMQNHYDELSKFFSNEAIESCIPMRDSINESIASLREISFNASKGFSFDKFCVPNVNDTADIPYVTLYRSLVTLPIKSLIDALLNYVDNYTSYGPVTNSVLTQATSRLLSFTGNYFGYQTAKEFNVADDFDLFSNYVPEFNDITEYEAYYNFIALYKFAFQRAVSNLVHTILNPLELTVSNSWKDISLKLHASNYKKLLSYMDNSRLDQTCFSEIKKFVSLASTFVDSALTKNLVSSDKTQLRISAADMIVLVDMPRTDNIDCSLESLIVFGLGFNAHCVNSYSTTSLMFSGNEKTDSINKINATIIHDEL